ncbi:MAG: S8 family serine peptidase [Lachnospiraceae bacterium]|nr:S8 family serine peptidase [Lachnospiraceae bacterium]
MLELIVRYVGDLKRLAGEIGFVAEELLGGYAIVRIRQEIAPLLLSAKEILWTEVPSRVYTEVASGRRAACVTALQARKPVLTGRGVLVAMIDSGIDYTHPDFRNEDGTTRIAALWDQTAGNGIGRATKQREDMETPERILSEAGTAFVNLPPEGYLDGVLYTRDRINAALMGERTIDGGSLVPESDLSGHGTHVAGIAAGNGRASGGRYRGVAYESELLVVKLSGTQADPFPQTTNLMAAVDFCVRYAAEVGMPLSINLSFGNNEGAHDGRSLLETYLDTAALYGRTCICIGTGNNASLGWHVGGTLFGGGEGNGGSGDYSQNDGRRRVVGRETEKEILFSVGPTERNIRMGLWLSSLDTVEISFVSPSGTIRRLSATGDNTAIKGYSGASGVILPFGNSAAEVFVGEATPYRILREIGITLRSEEGTLEEGIWRIRLRPVRILDGVYDIWIVRGGQSTATRFLQATPERTLTIPSTAERPIAVAAYDGRTDSITSFSGRGYPRGANGTGTIKPDLTAPGVDIVSCAPGGGYTTKTGTSMATPFVTGCAALLMQWGIGDGNDPYLYGERLKSFLIRGARELTGIAVVPNSLIGWGTLCAEESYRLLD